MINYVYLIKDVLSSGSFSQDRTGVGTYSRFGAVLRWNLQDGFPAVTCKRLAWRPVVGELLWFLEGSSNVERLRDITYGETEKPQNRTIWDDNFENQGKSLGYEDGELGPVYGVQWRAWAGVEGKYHDQLEDLITQLKEIKATGVKSRRLVVSAWNVGELEDMALPPCHLLFQVHVDGNTLHLQWYQRSVDLFLGLPFNIASYALLLHILCEITGYTPGDLIFTGGDVHIYANHLDQCNEMVNRSFVKRIPKLKILKPITCLDDLRDMSPSDFILENYTPHGTIKAPMAV